MGKVKLHDEIRDILAGNGNSWMTAVSLGFIPPHGGHHVRWFYIPGVSLCRRTV